MKAILNAVGPQLLTKLTRIDYNSPLFDHTVGDYHETRNI